MKSADSGYLYLVGSGIPAAKNPFFLNRQESQDPQARPSGEGPVLIKYSIYAPR